MAVYTLMIKHFRFPQLFILFSLFMITNLFSVLTPFTFTSVLSFNFTSFSPQELNISYEKAYTVEDQVIQLTGSTLEEGLAGRATYFRPMHLWNKASEKLTDFSTHFTFVIDSQNQTKYADGLTFFLAPNSSKLSMGAYSKNPGLYNYPQSNSLDSCFVAVEFDIWSNFQWDPPGAHVGIDINSMKSVANVPCSSLEIDNNNTNPKGSSLNHPAKKMNTSMLVVGFIVGGFILVGGLAMVLFVLRKRNRRDKEDDRAHDEEFKRGTGPWRFSYDELALATNDFNDKEKLGQGGFGGVYRGFLRDLDTIVAVKRVSEGSRQGIKEDIKSSNIMLDSNFNAKLGDFGLARLVDHAKASRITDLASTKGYMDPACVTTRRASKESDIYSFGIVELELACGRKPTNHEALEDQVVMLNWVKELHELGEVLNAADQRLGGRFNEQQMKCLLIVGLWCAHSERDSRPSIREAIQVLNFQAPFPLLQLDTLGSSYCTPMNEAASWLSSTNGATNYMG
ncbi:hypothetical protein SO802_028034 [Lithocarpus litseifolius]|uniref:Protein kinase domain-containing protein n=1 Tax=Lithocarpus litseifolius TaxID=425828 RepID=A0AAW2BUP3_9ROSI